MELSNQAGLSAEMILYRIPRKIKGFWAWWGSSQWVVGPAFLIFGCR